MDAAYDMVRDKRTYAERGGADDGPEVLPCPEGEPPAVAAQWASLAATCESVPAGDVIGMLDLARCLADMEEARRQVSAGGAFVMTKSGDLAENPWADRERNLRAQSVQLRRSIDCLGKRVISRGAAAEFSAKAEAAAKAEAEEVARAAAKKAEAAEKRRAKREAARLGTVARR